MTNSEISKSSQDGLVNLMADGERCAMLKDVSMNLTDITLNDRQICDLEMLAVGAFSPLTGFMRRTDYESVLDRMRLQDNTLWPVPVCLDISALQAKSLEAGQSVALKDTEGFLLAVMHIEDVWEAEREKEAKKIYGTTDTAHPGVRYLMNSSGTYYAGGNIEAVNLPPHYDFTRLRMTPEEVRSMYKKMGWHRVVGFLTQNPVHRPQFEMTLEAMQKAKANLLLLPVASKTGTHDFDHYTRVRCYREVVRKYPPDSYVMNLLPLAMRMTGPRDAVFNAIIARNFGCTHFIVNHDHGSPDPVKSGVKNGVNNKNGKFFYEPGKAVELALETEKEIGVKIIPFEKTLYLPFEDEYRFESEVTKGTQSIFFTDADIKERIRTGRRIPDWATFPEVLGELRRSYPPPGKQGLTVFFTGLSGAGKSTLAQVLYSKFLEIGDRPVTLLDGDIVRHNLSNELSFSKEHRDINVRRIGFVASEITKNRGIAICAPIAPYESTREEIRSTIEAYGGFVEVHVSTSIEICEKRDRKGMYAKARAGLIKGYTGVDDPYEIPEDPELRIDTHGTTPSECVQEILLFLGQKGFI
ncbi:bifunctional sulfate adenylyltransferase/adenylylsulfate kinase [Desulfobacterales bacterium HSG16]|nr:bifunctional sulfate adenylyltransferase/adenylylsulfate kinase [Desulfobacterales bacterium HSG16]